MKSLFPLFFLLLISGCASYSSKKEAFHLQFNAGNFEAASVSMYTPIEKQKNCTSAENKLLPSDFSDLGRHKFFIGLNTGTAAMYSHNYALSDAMFGVASDAITNDETASYSPKYYEKVMLNTYRALALLQAGDIENARVEFNRASSTQRDAAQENKKEITQLKEEAEAEQYQTNINAASEVIETEYNEFADFKPYADFVNPYTSYISGLFMTFNGSKSDIENGILDLKRVNSMSPENKFVKSDIRMAQNVANKKKVSETIWVVYENGLIAEVEKQRIAVPFIIDGKFLIAHMALPKMVPLTSAYPYIQVSAGKHKISTQNIVDMDRVMKTEFQNRYPVEVTKAVIWMTVNLATQVAIQNNARNNQLAAIIASAAIGSMSNPVETRTWSSLPKDIQVARLAMPKNRKVQILDNEGKKISEEIIIDKGIKQALIFVRVPTLMAKPSISVAKLK